MLCPMALVQMVKFTGKEEIECKAIADDAEAELNVALPALQKAMAEVEKLDKAPFLRLKHTRARQNKWRRCLPQ